MPHQSRSYTVTARTFDRPRAARPPFPLASWSTIAGGALNLVLGIPLAPFQDPAAPSWWIASLNAIGHLLLFAGMFGLARSGSAGRSSLAAAGRGITLFGLVGWTVAEPLSLIDMDSAELCYIGASLLMMLGLILAGVAVLRAGRWTGWRRCTPLACGLFMPLVIFPSFALPGDGSTYAVGLWGICWLLLGVAQLAEGEGRPFAGARG
jgi:hypothetical protein